MTRPRLRRREYGGPAHAFVAKRRGRWQVTLFPPWEASWVCAGRDTWAEAIAAAHAFVAADRSKRSTPRV